MHLAPTYDHASSLGRELLDVKRQERLKGGFVTAYVAKCRSALYAQVGDKKALFTLDADGVTTPSATTRRVGLRLIHGKKDRSRIVNKTAEGVTSKLKA